jgi:tetratricopeptide (TPR) repeat protein
LISGSRTLSAAEADLIPETVAFSGEDTSNIRKDDDRAREQARRRAILAQIRTKAARYPDDSFALRLLAEAEAASGNGAAAQTAADRMLASNPQNVPALIIKSRVLSRAAQQLTGAPRNAAAAKARDLAVKANRLDNNEPLALVAFYESYRAAGVKAPPSAVEGLSAAVATLPRNGQIRQMLVDELESQHRYAEAISVLAPVANSAHKSPRRDAAQSQMARLKTAVGGSTRSAPAAPN